MQVFGPSYAQIYDILYADKPYRDECDFLEEIFRSRGASVRTILEAGCGTGGHILPLVERGYRVTGVDRSGPMLELARDKLKAAALEAQLVQGDLRHLEIADTYDCVVANFAVISYLADLHELSCVLAVLRDLLRPGGLVVFDVWYGPAVVSQGPEPRIKRGRHARKEVVRFTEPRHDLGAQRVHVTFDFLVVEDGAVLAQGRETHSMRYYFPQEVEFVLRSVGFNEVRLTPHMHLDQELSELTWNMTVCAEKSR